MSKVGAPEGNQNAVKAKIWSDAVRKAVLSRKKLDKLANKLVALAEGGDLAALKELGDRLEGKATQAIEGTGQNGELNVAMTVRYIGGNSSGPTGEA